MHVIRHRKVFVSISAALVLVAFIAIALFGFKPSIDFTGGSLWQIRFDDTTVTDASLREFFSSTPHGNDAIIYPDLSSQSFIIKLQNVSELEHQSYLSELTARYGATTELQFNAIGPTIGGQLKQKSIYATILVIIGISLYVAFAFRKVSYPVRSWKYGVVTLISLLHDVAIPAGVIAVLGKYWGIEMDANFVVALLVIMGFSVHDTIVVFDRIRENLLLKRGAGSFDDIVEDSIQQTFARSINTSLTLVLVLCAMIIFGQPTLKIFEIIMLIGVVAGTYSSIFVASPLLTMWHSFGNNSTGKKNTK